VVREDGRLSGMGADCLCVRWQEVESGEDGGNMAIWLYSKRKDMN
jgi:hypothetical protein